MTNWILIATLAACSTPKGLETFDSGEEPEVDANGDETGGDETGGEETGGEETGGEETGGEEAGDETGGEETGGSTTGDGDAVGDPCESSTGILDCELTCWADASDMIGDGVCDDGTRGPNFFCTHFDYDLGDCIEGADEGGGSTTDGATTGGSTTGGTTTGGASTGGSTTAGTTGADTSDATGGGTTAGTTGDATGGSGGSGGSTTGGSSTGGSSTGGTSSTWDEGEYCGDFALPESPTLSASGTTEFASAGVPSSCTMTGHADSRDISYTWSPPTTEDYCINTDGSGYDTVLSIWDDGCVAEYACDDFSGLTSGLPFDGRSSAITFPADSGTTYVIVVDGSRSYTYGDYTLNITPGVCP